MKNEYKLLIILGIFSVFLALINSYLAEQKENNKTSFANEVKYILEKVGEKRLMTVDFDIGIINENTLKEILGIESNNYENIKIEMLAQKVHIIVTGKNKWQGLTACGTIEGISVVEGDTKCV